MRKLTSEHFDSVDLVVSQPERGYRYGAPTLLLKEFACVSAGMRVVELGSGSGVLAISIAAKSRPRAMVAVEIQSGLHDIALKNVERNNLREIVFCVNEDYRRFSKSNANSFDIALANPPFYRAGSGRLPLDPELAAAHHELNGTVGDLVFSASKMLVPGGRFAVVFPDCRRFELVDATASVGFEMKRVLRGKPFGSTDALILAEFMKRT